MGHSSRTGCVRPGARGAWSGSWRTSPLSISLSSVANKSALASGPSLGREPPHETLSAQLEVDEAVGIVMSVEESIELGHHRRVLRVARFGRVGRGKQPTLQTGAIEALPVREGVRFEA